MVPLKSFNNKMNNWLLMLMMLTSIWWKLRWLLVMYLHCQLIVLKNGLCSNYSFMKMKHRNDEKMWNKIYLSNSIHYIFQHDTAFVHTVSESKELFNDFSTTIVSLIFCPNLKFNLKTLIWEICSTKNWHLTDYTGPFNITIQKYEMLLQIWIFNFFLLSLLSFL